MIKKETYAYHKGLDIDSPPSKRGKDVYSMLRNGRITSSYSSGDNNNIGSDGVIRCADGNELVFSFGNFTSIDDGVNSGTISVSYNLTIDGDSVSYTTTFAGANEDLSTLSYGGGNNYVIATYSDGPDLYLLTTCDSGIDAIWKYTQSTIGATNPQLIYANALGWLDSYNYDIVINHESESVKRMYIADGHNQVFAINLLSNPSVAGNIMDKPKKVFYMVPSYNFSQPVVTEQISGGNHTPGYVQYAYTLFNINGGQTNTSPLSEMQVMSRYNGGGEVNESVGKSNVISTSNIDPSYDYIRIYRIKYNDLDVTPTVAVIGDYAIDGTTSITTTDDGSTQYLSSIEEFQFLGGTELVPRCIVGKKNRLIMANIKESPWDINSADGFDSVSDPFFFDPRCYSSTAGNLAVVILNDGSPVSLNPSGRVYTIVDDGSRVPLDYDCYQNKELYAWHPAELTTPGGEGRHLSYKILQTPTSTITSEGYDYNNCRYMKCGEVYRWAIQFYNNRSQKSSPQWIADVKVPTGYQGFSNNTRVTIEFEISASGIEALTAQGVIGYKFLRVERKENDKTIVAQGIVSSMIFQRTGQEAKSANKQSSGSTWSSGCVKMPSPWIRHLQDQIDVPAGSKPAVKINALSNYGCISLPNSTQSDDSSSYPWVEIYRDWNATPAGAAWLHWSFQDNRIMQLFSPETIFGNPVLSGGMKARIVGTLRNTARKSHGKMIYTDSSEVFTEVINDTSTSLFSSSAYNSDKWNGNYINANGYFGPNKPTYDLWRKTEQLIAQYREYTFNKSVSYADISILGAPELAKHDTQTRVYNGYPQYKYQNTLQNLVTDGKVEDLEGYVNESWDIPIFGVDSIATQNITFVDSAHRSYETIMNAAVGSIESTDNIMLMEIVRPQSSGQYGGYRYEDKTLNKYIEVGVYNTIATTKYNVIDNGDTFVGNFTFARVARVGDVSFNYQRIQYSEMVKFPVETSININNRNDNSFAGWEAQFLPTNEAFHKYNTVFSQEANAIHTAPDPYLFTKNTEFSNRILASKPKISGETIDSWLDILPNEEMYMEGEYGPINRLIKLNDNLYCFQRDGVAVVSVLPRVQTQGSDGIAIELGLGNVLNTYQYLNTQSGCADFNGIVSTSSSVYYADSIRRSLNIIAPEGLSGLSDKMQVSSYIKGYETTAANKPRYTLAFDPISDDVLFAIRRGYASVVPDSEVLMYSENVKRFTGIYDYSPEFLFTVDGKLHSVPSDDRSSVYSHFTNSNSCTFYGQTKPLELTICLNPEGALQDNIFNTIEWTHDIYNTTNIATRYDENITAFESWNDYLTSEHADISDIRRRFRISRLHIPRVSGSGISRMRGQYLFIKMTYTPSALNKSILLNDLTLYYNAQR